MATLANDRHWQRAWRYIRASQTAPARAALECILQAAPGDVRARVFLAAVWATEDRPQAAAAEVRRAAALPCADADVLLRLARIATRVGEGDAARAALAAAALRRCADPEVLLGAAEAWQVLSVPESALECLARAERAGAAGVRLHFYRGMQFGMSGNLAAAEREFLRCTGPGAISGNAFLQLALLRTQTPAHNHVAAIRRAAGRVPAGSDDCIGLQFALYHELEDLGRYPEAWDALAAGNRMVRERSPYDADGEAAGLSGLRAAVDSLPAAAAAPVEDAGPQPIFVIGLPRSGTTLLERILGNHPDVTSAGELAAFPHALSYALDHVMPVGPPDAVTLQRLGGVDWSVVARRYLDESRWRARGRAHYVDKLPDNWMLAGLLHRAFPAAPILHLARDPMDVCFSNWRAHLGMAPHQAFAYDLTALASHHREYRRMLRYWHGRLPGAILDVEYARLVREPEAVARGIFAFCGLPYVAGCTDITRNRAPAATLSMAEVREPIHQRAARRWAPYADHLAGLRAALAREEG